MKQYKRSSRISEQILRDVSEVIQKEYRGYAPTMITFTYVKVSDDLRYATIYYSALGSSDDEYRLTAEFFDREKKKIRGMIGKNLRMRHIPELTFKFDPSVEEGIRIEKLLNEIKTDSKE